MNVNNFSNPLSFTLIALAFLSIIIDLVIAVIANRDDNSAWCPLSNFLLPDSEGDTKNLNYDIPRGR